LRNLQLLQNILFCEVSFGDDNACAHVSALVSCSHPGTTQAVGDYR